MERVEPKTLHDWLASPNAPVVVDVRDNDHIGGHVRNSINVPSHRFWREVDDLNEKLRDAEKVVFYCQFSQQRGPTCAQMYARSAPSSQRIYVLDGGFSGWVHEYGREASFTAGLIPDLYDL